MVNGISNNVRAQVLWDAGHRTPKSMERRGNMPERSVERYIKELREGRSLEKKNIKQEQKLLKLQEMSER